MNSKEWAEKEARRVLRESCDCKTVCECRIRLVTDALLAAELKGKELLKP